MGTHKVLNPGAKPARSFLLGLYLAVTWVISGFASYFLKRRLAAGKEDPKRYREKLGQPSIVRPDGIIVWFHAVSVGESLSVLELIDSLLRARSDVTVLLTTSTVTSANVLSGRIPDRCITQFLPLDTSQADRLYLDHWRPDLAIWIESEFWPRLIYSAYNRAIPMLLVNARISGQSLKRWQKLPKLSAALMGRFSCITVSDDINKQKVTSLGALSEKVHITGSLKSNPSNLPFDSIELMEVEEKLGGRPLWLAASTHSGEETIVSQAHRIARKQLQSLLLIIAIRHPVRAEEIAAELTKDGWQVARRSLGQTIDVHTDIYLADTLGEMGLWYELSPVSFVGGSLVPIGGHNAYETAAHGSAILHGPHVENFIDLYARLLQAGASVEVFDAVSLAHQIIRLQDNDIAKPLISAAKNAVSTEESAVKQTLQLILKHLE